MPLEEKVKDNVWKRFFKKSLILGMALTMPYSFAPFSPSLVPLAKAFTYPVVAGRVMGNWATNRPALEGIVKESIGAAAASPIIQYSMNKESELEAVLSPKYGKVAGEITSAAAYQTVVTPFSTLAHTTLNYGTGTGFWSKYKERLKTNLKWTTIPVIINLTLVKYYGRTAQLFTSGLITASFGYLQRAFGGQAKFSNLYRNMKKSLNPIPALREMYHSIFRPAQPQYGYA
ncbi:hypothetical protein HYT54_01395 [Candidatus Woesearchaeota archaeon]|nr:hypothetical protein [Candidatus Woesearchaeota archaeon]